MIAILCLAAPMADVLTRRAALGRTLAGTGIVTEWRDEGLAEVSVSGSFTGSPNEVVRKLLAGTSYVLIYAADGESLSRIIVTGAATGTMPAAPSRNKALAAANADAIAQRRSAARDKVLRNMQATAEAVRKRLAELPPGNHIIRTQAVRLNPGATPGQTGNIPLLSSAYDLDR